MYKDGHKKLDEENKKQEKQDNIGKDKKSKNLEDDEKVKEKTK